MQPLSPEQIRIERDRWGKLACRLPDGQSIPITAQHLFPISDPAHWISLRGPQGKELACLESLQLLDAASRTLVEDELASQEFFPIIERVRSVSSLSEPCEWTVVTDRGETRFVLKSEDDVRRLGPHQAVIVDAHGIRYLVPDSRKLDARSRQYVEWYL
jgi:hypothetical protein